MTRKTTLPVALIQERTHGDAAANLSVIETRVTEAAKRARVSTWASVSSPSR